MISRAESGRLALRKTCSAASRNVTDSAYDPSRGITRQRSSAAVFQRRGPVLGFLTGLWWRTGGEPPRLIAVQPARYRRLVRWYCERCGAEFDEPETEEGQRAAAARFYRVEPDKLDPQDVETLGCHNCGYASWLIRWTGKLRSWRSHDANCAWDRRSPG